MGKVETLSVEETAKIIGTGAEYVRLGLRQQRFDFGSAVKSKSGKRWNYNIIKSKVYKYADKRNEEGSKTSEENQ